MADCVYKKKISQELLYKMILIRTFENEIEEYKMKGKIYGMAHCYNGQEGVAVGVCSALRKTDYIVSNHRPHGHAIAKGVDMHRMMAEIFGKSTGTNGGKGGSMHVHDKECGLITSTGIVGSGIPVACGSAFASKYLHNENVTCVFLGDGAANEGVFQECINIASIWKLPIIFVIEDNGVAVTTLTKNTSACSDYTVFASAYGLDAYLVNGQDVQEVYKVATDAILKARKESKPSLIQAKTIRFHEHAEGQWYQRMKKVNYRDNRQLERNIAEMCPIKLYINKLLSERILDDGEIEKIREDAKQKIQECIDFAIKSPKPLASSAFENVYF